MKRIKKKKQEQKKKQKQKSKFMIGYAVYMLCLFVVIAAGLMMLWMRLEVYEKSRPDKTLESYVEKIDDSSQWRELLVGRGVKEDYVDMLDLENVSYHKKWDMYTEDEPAYSICFGDTEMLFVSLIKGKELKFGYNEWEIGNIGLTGSRLCIYAPKDAVILVDGKDVSGDYPVQENAQELELGIFDANRKDIQGLSRYQLDKVYTMDGVVVKDNSGNVLELSYTSGSSYYYAPFMNDYKITAPTGSSVTVNGIALTKDNALIENCSDEDFEGIEKFVSALPTQTVYIIEGLIMPPEVVVKTDKGDILEASVEGTEYLYEISGEITDNLSAYVMTVFDAYVAYSGNRNRDIAGNYSRYISYVAPGSEASERAYRAQGAIEWVPGRDTKLKSAMIKKYTPYSEELFSCQIDYTMTEDETDNANSYLFVFVKYRGEWKLARVLSKTSFLS